MQTMWTHLELAVGCMESNGLETQQSAGLTRKVVEKKTDHDWDRMVVVRSQEDSTAASPLALSFSRFNDDRCSCSTRHDTIGGL